jgi:amino acid transporter
MRFIPRVRIFTDYSTDEEVRPVVSLGRRLFGRPLSTDEDIHQRVGPAAGAAVFGLDALGSTAYGPEAALTALLAVGWAASYYILPLSAAIIGLLAIVYFSYRQTIAEYPVGGGAYTIARRNLGATAGLAAGAALMIDYILNVAVGISTGVGALVSAVPSWHPYTLQICLGMLALISFVNLRGMRESGLVLMAPMYLFVLCLLAAVCIGVAKTLITGGHPQSIVPPRPFAPAIHSVSAWLLIRAFANGCTALTGVEAVSNGVQAFREPTVKNARLTLTLIVAILIVLLGGVSFLTRAYHIGATEPGRPGYESLLSQMVGAVTGRGLFYYVTMSSILMVLSLSANTSFAAFPRLCRVIAQSGYLPYSFTARGQRLVYTQGVYALTALAATLLIVFGGVTDHLIPLFAIGAFLSFTFSQAGMVMHWKKKGGPGSARSMLINLIGTIATGVTVVIVTAAKFTEGAWISLGLIPAFMLLMLGIRRHYHAVKQEIANPAPLKLDDLTPPLVVVPVEEWNNVAKKALRFAMTISGDVQGLHIDAGEHTKALRERWAEWVAEPAQSHQRKPPELVIVESPYRYVIGPIVHYVLELERRNRPRRIAVVLSELVERRWYQYLLHDQRARTLTTLLTTSGSRGVYVINVPWHLNGYE